MLILFDNEGYRSMYRELDRLFDENLSLWALVQYTALAFDRDYGKSIVITSIWRDEPWSVHYYWRGVDLRIGHPDRGIAEDSIYWGPSYREAREIVAHLNEVFGYDDDHEVAVIHGEGLNTHIHLQTKDFSRWVQA